MRNIKNVLFCKLDDRTFFIVMFLFAFFYTLIVSGLVQAFIFPHMPSISDVHGILLGDNQLFHKLAVEMSANMKLYGWQGWKLYPEGAAGGLHVGILAIIYYFFGVNPILIIPVNALMQSLAFCFLLATFKKPDVPNSRLFWAGVPLLLMPSTLLWTSQFLKDNYIVFAWMVLFYLLINLKNIKMVRLVALFGTSLSLFVLVRPLYLNLVVLISLLLFLLRIILYCLKKVGVDVLLKSTAMFFLAAVFLVSFNYLRPIANVEESYFVSNKFEGNTNPSCNSYKWVNVGLPLILEKKLQVLAGMRANVICNQPKGTSSTLDDSFVPASAIDFVTYLPRAAYISLFEPTPIRLFSIFNTKSFLVLVEMLFYYFCLFFCVMGIRRASRDMLILIGIVLGIEIFLSFIIPNMGSFHRIRFPFLMVFVSQGILTFLTFIEKKSLQR